MKKAVLFDLGGTLIKYYERKEFPSILYKAIYNVKEYLKQKNYTIASESTIWQRVENEKLREQKLSR